MNEQVYNLSLIPDDSFSKHLVRYAQNIDKDIPYKLGNKSLAHLTLLQFKANEDEVESILKLIRPIELSISTLGFQMLRFNGIDSWGVEVIKSQELSDLQSQYAEKIDKAYLNGIGDKFSPHFTLLGWNSSDKLLDSFEVDEQIIYQSYIKCKLSLGVSDAQCQFVRKIC